MHCITFEFSQCFMHYRCVFTMLKSCVLVRFDWAEPMMFLLLHVTHSCIFHAYIPFILYLIDIDLCLVLFYLSLSLSLSRLFWSMAPKKSKSTPSRNLLHSEATTSNSTPSHIWFCDEKACTNFSKNFSRHSIHSERQVILSDFFDTDLPTIIYSRGWESLCGIPLSCPSVII